MLNVLSLCDGISMLREALKDVPCNYYASEIEQVSINISKANYPDIIQLGDINNVEANSLPEIDLLVASTPCTSFSRAGKQQEFNSSDGQLFYRAVEILNIVKPKYFIFENVKMSKEAQDEFSRYLGVQPVLLNSSNYSYQSRVRNYWCNFDIDTSESYFNDYLASDLLPEGHITVKMNGRKGRDGKYYQALNRQKTNKFPTLTSFPTCNMHIHKDDYKSVAKEAKGDYIYGSPELWEAIAGLPEGYTEVDGVSKTNRKKVIGKGYDVRTIKHILKGII